jgi:hypothetical protein
MQEGEPFALIEELQRQAHFEGAREIITIDGLARRVRRRFRPRPSVEHHAGGRPALRGRLGRCGTGTHSGGFSPRLQRGAARSASALLTRRQPPGIPPRSPQRATAQRSPSSPCRTPFSSASRSSTGSRNSPATSCPCCAVHEAGGDERSRTSRHSRAVRRLPGTRHAERARQQPRLHRYRRRLPATGSARIAARSGVVLELNARSPARQDGPDALPQPARARLRAGTR